MILYVGYTNLPPHAPCFKVLENGAESIELVTRTASIFGNVATQLHCAGKPDEPLVEIVAVTAGTISADEARDISQGAINFLMETGALPHK